jgi:hypothetical protein
MMYIGENKPSQPSRAQRSAAAAAEISSLAPAGIDARSLAATPPPSFTIRRVDESASKRTGPIAGRGGFRGSGTSLRGSPGGMRGRGMPWRGGSRGGRGRGGGATRGTRKRRGGSNSSLYAEEGAPLTPEEQTYVDSVEMGVPTPAHVGVTDLETLKKEVPGLATATAPIGLVNTIRDSMRAFAGQHGNEYLSSEQHAKHYLGGNRATLFVDEEDRARAVGPNRFEGAPRKYKTLDETEREPILQTLVAGQYQPIKPPAKENPLTAIDAYTQRNETYLPKDGAALKARVQRMLPAQSAAKPVRQAARP